MFFFLKKLYLHIHHRICNTNAIVALGSQLIMFEFWLFTTDPALAGKCIDAGVTGIVIDWEYLGKNERQKGVDLECNYDSFDDLIRMRQAIQAKIICRINPSGSHTEGEVEQAISGGADVIMLPMVREPKEVEAFLSYVNDRAECGILVETSDALFHASTLSGLPLDYVYIGLNDLALSRGFSNIFSAICDGTVQRMRAVFREIKFGFGGITVLDKGFPIPFDLLLREMVALECDFGFLRRSFRRDIIDRDVRYEMNRLYQAIAEYQERPAMEIKKDRLALKRMIDSIDKE